MTIYHNHELIVPARRLNEAGEVEHALPPEWPYECPTCHTKYVPEEPEYRFCDGCGCYTTVYRKEFRKLAGEENHNFVILCKDCYTGVKTDIRIWDKIRKPIPRIPLPKLGPDASPHE